MRGSVLIHLAWSNGNSSVSYSFHFSSLSELRTWKDKLGVKLSHLYSFRPWRTLGSSLTLQTLKHRWMYDWMKLMNEWMDRESGKEMPLYLWTRWSVWARRSNVPRKPLANSGENEYCYRTLLLSQMFWFLCINLYKTELYKNNDGLLLS